MEQRSAEIRGEADAAVIKITAEAYGKSPEFYQFLRQLEAYKKTLGSGTKLVLSTHNEFLRLIGDSGNAAADAPK
jgi:membrane protease subunit HflC